MCLDNPNVQNDPADLARMVHESIGAFVEREIFATPQWRALRLRYPGYSDLELFKAAALQTKIIIYLDIQPGMPVVFREEDFARSGTPR